MDDIIIKNMLRTEDGRTFASIVKPMSGGRYQVRDSQGRTFSVDSDAAFTVGAGVKIKNGVIIGGAKRIAGISVFVV